jgi:hypothetical protein
MLVFGVMIGIGGQTLAQEKAAAPEKPTALLNDSDTVLIQRALLAREVADTTCQNTVQYKNFTLFINEATAKIKDNHPGFELDWTKLSLVAVKKTDAKK